MLLSKVTLAGIHFDITDTNCRLYHMVPHKVTQLYKALSWLSPGYCLEGANGTLDGDRLRNLYGNNNKSHVPYLKEIVISFITNFK